MTPQRSGVGHRLADLVDINHGTWRGWVRHQLAQAEYISGRLSSRDLAARARILGWDGETSLGALRLASWDDDFVATYKVSNYQLAPGVSCP